jgi:hypothetical protein
MVKAAPSIPERLSLCRPTPEQLNDKIHGEGAGSLRGLYRMIFLPLPCHATGVFMPSVNYELNNREQMWGSPTQDLVHASQDHPK